MGRGVAVCLLVLFALVFSVSVSASVQDEQLATLAGFLLNISNSTDQDYTMSCGPANEVLGGGPYAASSPSVCVVMLKSSGLVGTNDQVIVGTVGSSKEIGRQFLELINQSPFIGPTLIKNVKTSACDASFQKSVSAGFTVCDGALVMGSGTSAYRNSQFSVYAYNDAFQSAGAGTSGSFYVLLSDKPVPGTVQSATFFTKLIDFFKGLFGWSG